MSEEPNEVRKQSYNVVTVYLVKTIVFKQDTLRRIKTIIDSVIRRSLITLTKMTKQPGFLF